MRKFLVILLVLSPLFLQAHTDHYKNYTNIEMEIFNIFDNPSARTDHGELPVVETNKRPSPKPNKVNPTHKSIKVVNLGFKFKGFSELQDFEGIFLMVKNIII